MDRTLTEVVACITLDGTDASRMTQQKEMALRAVMVAKYLDSRLDKLSVEDVTSLSDFKFKRLKSFESEIVPQLEEKNLITKKLKLIACDINYYTAGVEPMAYIANKDIYQREVEFLRAEMLEDGEKSLESIIIFSLLKEAGVVNDIFSIREQQDISSLLIKEKDNKLHQAILALDFHSSFSSIASSFIKTKNNLFKNPYLQGTTMIFPFLDRREAIFIDTIVLGTKFQDRQDAIVDYLQNRGFDAEKCVYDGLMLLRIDNMLYRTWSTTRTFKLPVQGMAIQPYYN